MTYRGAWDDHLKHEEQIVWLEDPTALPVVFVRQIIVTWSTHRTRPVGDLHLPGRVVGYSTLRSHTPRNESQLFTRRVWWIGDYDRAVYSTGTEPFEAVDPETIKPGVPARGTERSWAGRRTAEGSRLR